MLLLWFTLATVSFAMFSLQPNSLFIINALLLIGGAAIGGSQTLTIAFISQYYPSAIRSTGVGWGLGIGRIGAIIAPTLGGFLLSQNYPLETNFLFLMIPAIIGIITVSLIRHKPDIKEKLEAGNAEVPGFDSVN